MTKYIILLITLISLFLPAVAFAAEAESGTIEGRIVNRTEGGSGTAELDITLQTYQGDTEISSITTRTDAGGYFVFENLITEGGNDYQVTVDFQGAEYNSEWLYFNEGETSKFIEITVFDSTTSDEVIKIAMAHTIIYAGQDGSFEVKDYFLFVNESDLTYIGLPAGADEEVRETLIFSLPEGATRLQPTIGLMECCLTETEGGFVYSMPILPGSGEVAYSYMINNASGTYTFYQDVNYPIARYDLLLQGENIKVKDTQLVEGEPMDINGALFAHYSGEDFAPGNIITAQLSDLVDTSNQRITMWTGIGLVLFAIGFIGIYWRRKRRLQPVSIKDRPDQGQERLLLEIVRLDDDFADGKIAEDDYRKLRAEKKAEITALMLGEKGENGGR